MLGDENAANRREPEKDVVLSEDVHEHARGIARAAVHFDRSWTTLKANARAQM